MRNGIKFTLNLLIIMRLILLRLIRKNKKIKQFYIYNEY